MSWVMAILWWDLVFWDDTLPLGAGVGAVVGDEEVTGWSPEGYVYQRRVVVPEPLPALDGSTRLPMGQVQLELRRSTRTDPVGGVVAPIIVGRVVEDDVDLAALGLLPPSPGESLDDSAALVTVGGLAPFGVTVDRRTGRIVASDVVVPPDRLKVEIGSVVMLDAEARGVVLELRPDGSALVRAEAKRVDAAPLRDPDEVSVPSWSLGLVLVPTSLAALGLRRRRRRSRAPTP